MCSYEETGGWRCGSLDRGSPSTQEGLGSVFTNQAWYYRPVILALHRVMRTRSSRLLWTTIDWVLGQCGLQQTLSGWTCGRSQARNCSEVASHTQSLGFDPQHRTGQVWRDVQSLLHNKFKASLCYMRTCLNKNLKNRVRNIAQLVECSPRMYKALDPISSTT